MGNNGNDKIVDLNDYMPANEFIRYNKNTILEGINFDNKCIEKGGIIDEMSKYLILPLIRDAVFWIFEFIRNLIHFGYKEYLYVGSFYIYLNIYELYFAYFYTLNNKHPFICDFCIFMPFIIAHIVGTFSNSQSYMHAAVYIFLAYSVVFIPRLFLITVNRIKDVLVYFKLIKGYGHEVYEYASACAIGILYGASFAMGFYSQRVGMIASMFSSIPITDLYMRECMSGLIVFSMVRALFLYSENLIDRASSKEKNVLISANKVMETKHKLFMFMIYMMFILGSVSFLCTYYSLHRAMVDTKIVEDVKCIDHVASQILADPLVIVVNIAKSSLSNMFTGIVKSIGIFFDEVEYVAEGLVSLVENAVLKLGSLFSLLHSVDITSIF